MSLRNKLPAVFLAIICVLAVAGCAYPTPSLHQGGQRPAIGFSDAPPSAIVVVDGIKMGRASQYNGDEHVLVVESGPHSVSLKENGNVIYQKYIYLGSGETRIIDINR